jgi:hypothetical protein
MPSVPANQVNMLSPNGMNAMTRRQDDRRARDGRFRTVPDAGNAHAQTHPQRT